MASSIDNSSWLQWMTTLMGGVSRQSHAATLPPDRFYCLLDELPLHLIPQHISRSLRIADDQQEAFYLNHGCVLCTEGEMPEELTSQKQLLSGFALKGTIAWVRNRATGNLLPFWLGPRLQAVVRSLTPDAPAPSTLPEDVRTALVGAEILVPMGHALREEERRQEATEKSAQLFRARGYAPLSGLIHPFHIAALRRYYRYLIRTGTIHLGDKQSERRYVEYNEPVAQFFHRQIAATLSAVAGEPLKPSYVYMASYLSGAELKRHTDREQCEFSVTLCLDFSPEPRLETPWPIQLDGPAGGVTVHQALGDGLAYRGTRLPHYRSVLGEGQTSTSIFFHYVPADFAGSLE